MSLITEIVRNVVALALIFSCLELFLPQGELSRFVRLACALIMLALIIIPISERLQGLSWSGSLSSETVYAEYDATTEQISLILEAAAMDEYERDAARQIEGLAVLAEEVGSAEAAVEADPDSGVVIRVEITVLRREAGDDTAIRQQIEELLASYLQLPSEIIYLQIREEQ